MKTHHVLHLSIALGLATACTEPATAAQVVPVIAGTTGGVAAAPATTAAPAGTVLAQAATTAAAPEPTSQPTSQPAATSVAPNGVTMYQGEGPVPNQAAASTVHYGAPFSIADAPITLASALETCADGEKVCKVEGTIERVCQSKGCWFVIAAPGVEVPVRIKMKDYGFFVPRNSAGAAVVFEGVLKREEIPQAVAQHYANDEAAAGTAPPRVVTGPESTYEFTISAAEVAMK